MAGKRPVADWEGVKVKYPSTGFGEKHWVAIFDSNPDILWRIIGDICKAVVATEVDVRKTGRRPTPQLSLRDVERIISPNYSLEPFPQAVESLMAGRSQRAFAARVPVHHHTLRRLITGEVPLTIPMMEAIAKAGRVQPHYFVEYRAAVIAEAVLAHFRKFPNQSVRAFKEMRRAEGA